jgi:hypothetical protein
MNSLADHWCKQARACPNQTTYYNFLANEDTFVLQDQTINTKATTKAFHSIHLRQYLKKKYEWSNQHIDNICWKIHQKSLSCLQRNDQTRIYKFIHNYLPTNQKLNQQNNYHPSLCQCCKSHIEMADHVIKCPAETQSTIRQRWISNLKNFLSKPHTSVTMKQCIMKNLQNWLSNTTSANNEEECPNTN